MGKSIEKKYCQDNSDRMNVREVAEYFSTSPVTVYRWIRNGLLPCKRTPTGYIAYVPREAVEQFQVR